MVANTSNIVALQHVANTSLVLFQNNFLLTFLNVSRSTLYLTLNEYILRCKRKEARDNYFADIVYYALAAVIHPFLFPH